MSRSDVDDLATVAAAESRKVRRDLRQTMLAGVALTVPFFVTLLVLAWVLDAISNALVPLVDLLGALGLDGTMRPILLEVLAAGLVFGLVFVVGLAAQHGPETSIGRRIDALVEDVPGIGSIYTSVERMSDVLLEGDTDSFREVKLVEFPCEDCFSIAFLTADAPETIEDAAGREELVTLFVPLAPNPVMGGHLVTLPAERVHDTDLSVEEGMQAIVTTGMAIDENVREEAS